MGQKIAYLEILEDGKVEILTGIYKARKVRHASGSSLCGSWWDYPLVWGDDFCHTNHW